MELWLGHITNQILRDYFVEPWENFQDVAEGEMELYTKIKMTDEEKTWKISAIQKKKFEEYKTLSPEERYEIFKELIEGHFHGLIYQRGVSVYEDLYGDEIFESCSSDLKCEYGAVAPEEWKQRVEDDWSDLFWKVVNEIFPNR